MSFLIDETFFVGDINIPNTGKQEIKNNLFLFINKYEYELLNSLFGKELYDLLQSNPEEERFQNLIKQLVYSINGQQYSLIAYYVYWFWLKDKEIWNSGIGTIRPIPDTAISMSPALKMVQSWNNFSYGVCKLYEFLNDSEDYPEWEPFNYSDFKVTNDFDI